MKFTRRDFLRGGLITAAALAVGLKPDEIIFSPGVDLFADFEYYWPMDGDFLDALRHNRDAIYDGAAGGGKTPHPADMIEQLLLVTEREMEFLHGDPRFHCRGVLVVKGDEHA